MKNAPFPPTDLCISNRILGRFMLGRAVDNHESISGKFYYSFTNKENQFLINTVHELYHI